MSHALEALRWLVIDTETTGVDQDTAMVVELGAVMAHGDRSCVAIDTRVDPGIPIPVEATAVHGITDDYVSTVLTIDELAPVLLAAVGWADLLVAYNWPYDARILSRLVTGWDDAIAGKAVVDPLVLVRTEHVGRWWKGKGRHQLSSVAARFGVAVEGAHGAAADCLMALGVLRNIIEEAAERDRHGGYWLPQDHRELHSWVLQQRNEQQQEFEAWLARQPPRTP